MLVFFASLISVVLLTPINSQLPGLIKYQHQLPTEEFSVRNKELFRYSIEGDEYPQVSINDSLGNTVHTCVVLSPYTTTKTIFQYNTPQNSQSKLSFVVIKYENLIYTVDHNLSLTAYSFDESTIKKVATTSLETSEYDRHQNSRTFFVSTTGGKFLFLFSTYGVWKIDTSSVLAKIERIRLEFDTIVYSAVNLGSRLFMATEHQGILIYNIGQEGDLNYVASSTKFKGTTISPVDLAVDTKTNLLFAIDYRENIYVYRLTNKLLEFYDVIELKHQVNHGVRVEGNKILYTFVENGRPQIAELEYNQTSKQASLVRYFKHLNFITDFFTAGNQLYVMTGETLEIFPINLDPRLIHTEHNGMSMPLFGRRISQVGFDKFVLLGEESISLIRLQKGANSLLCNLSNHKEVIRIRYTTNISNCNQYNPSFQTSSYNSFCEVSRQITLNINIPEQSEREKILIYAIVMAVFLVFLASLVCLIQWRNGRLDIIDQITDEIVSCQKRNKRLQPYQDFIEVDEPIRSFGNDFVDCQKA